MAAPGESAGGDPACCCEGGSGKEAPEDFFACGGAFLEFAFGVGGEVTQGVLSEHGQDVARDFTPGVLFLCGQVIPVDVGLGGDVCPVQGVEISGDVFGMVACIVVHGVHVVVWFVFSGSCPDVGYGLMGETGSSG